MSEYILEARNNVDGEVNPFDIKTTEVENIMQTGEQL